MGRPKLLDLFCCAGGAGMGYHLAGFDVVGVDINPQPRYPFEFHQADALEFLAEHGHEFDAVHASPPCQRYANVTKWRGKSEDHPDLLFPTIRALQAADTPWIVENVPDAEFGHHLVLCGSHFGLKVRRHRKFRFGNWVGPVAPADCRHVGLLPFMHKGERAYADAMECTWMTAVQGRQAIPPAYTRYLGEALIGFLQSVDDVREEVA